MLRVVGEPLKFVAAGPYGQQDLCVDEVNLSVEADVLALIEGNGENGIAIANDARLAVIKAAEIDYSEKPDEAQYLPDDVAVMLGAVTKSLKRTPGYADYSGAAVTATVVMEGLIRPVYAGDLLAYFVPHNAPADKLLSAHNRRNEDERTRAESKGGVLRRARTSEGVGRFWYDVNDEDLEWGLDTLRSIGHFAARFVEQEPVLAPDYKLEQPGQLVIASPGVFAPGYMDASIERIIREGSLTQEAVDQMAKTNKYDASIIIAQIG
ncbi:MAG TPA: hypothetical protein VLG47_06445 [Candidatus Saccharimonadales bacterium]|nr:hypothetical protein [Candidatus Saccharimonadales bacterium]